MEVNIHEAKTQLSRLIERALKGEEVTFAKAGQWCASFRFRPKNLCLEVHAGL